MRLVLRYDEEKLKYWSFQKNHFILLNGTFFLKSDDYNWDSPFKIDGFQGTHWTYANGVTNDNVHTTGHHYDERVAIMDFDGKKGSVTCRQIRLLFTIHIFPFVVCIYLLFLISNIGGRSNWCWGNICTVPCKYYSIFDKTMKS